MKDFHAEGFRGQLDGIRSDVGHEAAARTSYQCSGLFECASRLAVEQL